MGAHNPNTLTVPPGSRLEHWIAVKRGKGWPHIRIGKEAGIGRTTISKVLKRLGLK